MPFLDLDTALPTTPEHWHAVAMNAAGQIMIDELRRVGLLTGGPAVDRARCDELLALAAAQDVLVSVDQAANAGIAFYAGWNDEQSPYAGVSTATLRASAAETCGMTLGEFRLLDLGEQVARLDVLDELASRWAAELDSLASTPVDPRDLHTVDRIRRGLRAEVSRAA